MKEKKLTDEEIVKAYEYCIANSSSCVDCPYDDWGCAVNTKDILEVVNRQKAEIERLTEENNQTKDLLTKTVDECEKLRIENRFVKSYKKQVDELKEKNKALAVVIDSYKDGAYSSEEIINALNRFYCPIVEEERAREKEIFDKLFGFVGRLAEEYGVEVK